jgi:hypothetical protein
MGGSEGSWREARRYSVEFGLRRSWSKPIDASMGMASRSSVLIRSTAGALSRAAHYMCTPKANLGQPPREPFVIQLREECAEWSRRRTAHSEPRSEREVTLRDREASRRG